MPGLCVRRVSLRRGKRRTSSPLLTAHVDTPSEAWVQAPPKTQARGRRGRPHGSQHRHRRAVARSPALRCIPAPSKRVRAPRGAAGTVVALLCEGARGPHDALHLGRHGRIPPEPGWLTGARDDRRSGACPRCGTKLRRATIAGRTTVWCPACQPKR